MGSYKLVIPPMTIHFNEHFPMRKKPVMAVSFDGENCQYKVASFNSAETMQWFVDCLSDALEQANVRRFPDTEWDVTCDPEYRESHFDTDEWGQWR